MKHESFAGRLTTLLESNQHPINQLAVELNVSRQSIYNWLSTNSISKASLIKLADYFNVSAHWLRYGSDAKSPIKVPAINQLQKQQTLQIQLTAINSQLSTSNLLIGTYLFAQGTVNWLGNKTLLVLTGRPLPLTFTQLYQLIGKRRTKHYKRTYLSQIKRQQQQHFDFVIKLGKRVMTGSFMIISNQKQQTIGFSLKLSAKPGSQCLL